MNRAPEPELRAAERQYYSKNKKNFVTVFPPGENVHLSKDVGQIPQAMARQFGFDSRLVTESGAAFPGQAGCPAGFKVVHLRKWPLFRRVNLATFHHLWRNARAIDVLNLYHLSVETKLLALLYKRANPQGYCYIKLDVNVQDEKAALARPPRPAGLRRYLGTRFHRAFFGAVDVFSAESAEGVAVVSQRYPLMEGKVIEVTNGIEVAGLAGDGATIGEGKEDLMLTVGRIGTHQKNNELLLRALARADLKQWKVAIVGPFTPEFEGLFRSFLDQHPGLRGRVELVGNISDRDALMAWYARARVLVMTSRWEGFPLVFPEAQCHGNYIISTDVSSVAEITQDSRFGRVVGDNEDAMASAMTDVIASGVCNADMSSAIATYAREKYDWKNALRELHDRISKHI